MQPPPAEVVSYDPLPEPADGRQAMYLIGYDNVGYGLIGGLFDLNPRLLRVEAGRRYTLDLALGQRSPYQLGTARVTFYTGLAADDYVLDEEYVYITDLPDGGFNHYQLEIDPPDRYDRAGLGVRIELMQDHAGYSVVMIDNVTITALVDEAD